jgi:hypothetical protein
METIRKTEVKFRQILKWVSVFAISVNEVNASLGRVVTAPTNGSAGTVPAVLMYYLVIENHQATFEDMKRFMLVAGEVGSLFKKGATISAAMGGCQAEIGSFLRNGCSRINRTSGRNSRAIPYGQPRSQWNITLVSPVTRSPVWFRYLVSKEMLWVRSKP